MLCQNCGKNEVTFRYTQVVNGVKKELNLCDNCARELGLKDMSFSMPISFSSFLSDFFNDYSNSSLLPSFMGTKQLQCNNCGTTFDDFLNTGLFGCDECYDTFEDRIEPLLRKIQGSNKHIGRGYKNEDPTSKVNNKSNIKIDIKEEKEDKDKVKIDTLQKDLQKAIKDERYEDAAKIRDEIKKIENSEKKNTKIKKEDNKKVDDKKDNKEE